MPGSLEKDGPLGREELERAFEALSDRLAARGVRAHLYVVGGAAMLLAHRRSASTTDVDALVIDPRSTVLEEAKAVGRAHGMDDNWLNDRVVRVPGMAGRRPDETPEMLYSSPNLVVTGASARHMLALKVRAGRETDADDIALLIRKLGIRYMSEVREVHRAVFPEDELRKRAEDLVSKVLMQEAIRQRHARSARLR